MKKIDTRWVREVVLEAIEESYAAWRERRRHSHRAPEPTLTVAVLVDYIRNRTHTGMDIHWLSRREQASLVRGALRHLERERKVTSSIGIGPSGREAQMWSPAKGTSS